MLFCCFQLQETALKYSQPHETTCHMIAAPEDVTKKSSEFEIKVSVICQHCRPTDKCMICSGNKVSGMLQVGSNVGHHSGSEPGPGARAVNALSSCMVCCCFQLQETASRVQVRCRWAAVLGIILAVSRGLVQEPGVANDPELVLLEVVAHTHYLPRHWRSRAHTREVHSNFQALFPFKVRPPTKNLNPSNFQAFFPSKVTPY